MSDADKGYEWTPIQPWYDEIVRRMHEAHAAGTSIVNLSYSYPRGYIPNQIIRRPAIRALLSGWMYDNTRRAPAQYPPYVWLPQGWPTTTDLNYCPLTPFLKEIELRDLEAQHEAAAKAFPTVIQNGQEVYIPKPAPVTDLTNFHPRGGIHPIILERIHRRQSAEWQRQVQEEVDRLMGLANKDESFAKTQLERAEAVEDRAGLETSAKELKQRAAQYRAQAKWLREEAQG